jgi:large subunit ribosomal protein L30
MAKEQTKMLKVTLVHSPIGSKQAHRACVRGLGLKKLNQSVEVPDTPAMRGMIDRVFYLVKYAEESPRK